MNQKEREILSLEEDLKDTIENELINQSNTRKKEKIIDIKLVGQITWKDKISGKPLHDNLFIVKKEVIELNRDGKERKIQSSNYYLGDKCIAASIIDNQIVYSNIFINSEPDKMRAVTELLSKVSEKEIEENSLNNLRKKEIVEVLSVHLGKEVSEEEVEKILEDMDKDEIEELKDEKENRKDIDENELSEKQTEKIKVNGIQRVDLNKLVDGKETLGKRLDLEDYDAIYVDYSEKVKEISSDANVNNTTYALIGIRKDGTATVLNNEFEMDKTVGNNATREQTKIRANNTATRDNRDLSVYTRKSNGASIGCENDHGNVNMFLYQKTFEENENVGIQIETSKTPIIPIETREIMNRNKGIYQKDKVQDEIQEHTDKECIPDDVRDFDGDENTSKHEHFDSIEIDRNDYIPNTNITWQDFMNRCGYRGEGDLEVAIEKVNELQEVNQETVEQLIEEKQEGYILEDKEHNHNQNNI